MRAFVSCLLSPVSCLLPPAPAPSLKQPLLHQHDPAEAIRGRRAGGFAFHKQLGCASVHAQSILFQAGAACQPAKPTDATRLDFSEGSARNVFAAPGTSDQVATVVCPLPAVPPEHVMTGASVAYYDSLRRWDKCWFLNAWPATPPRWALVTSVPDRPWIGTADLVVDSSTFVPTSVRCTVRPGQFIYAVTTEVVPIGTAP